MTDDPIRMPVAGPGKPRDVPSWKAVPLHERLDAAGVTRPVETPNARRPVPMPEPPIKLFKRGVNPFPGDAVAAAIIIVVFALPVAIALWRWALS